MPGLETQNASLLIGCFAVITNQLFKHQAYYLKLNCLKMILLVVRFPILFDAGELRSELSLTSSFDTHLRNKIGGSRFSIRLDREPFHFINVAANQILLKRKGVPFNNRKLDFHS